MKKISVVVIVVSLISSTMLLGQATDKGNFIIGSTLGFSTASSKINFNGIVGETEAEGPSSLQFSIAPKLAYFLADNLALGIGMDYTFSEVQEPNQDRIKDSDLLFGPIARYYLPVADDMAFLLETSFGFGTTSDVILITDERQTINTNIFAFSVGPGFTIISTEAIGIEALVKYNFARSRFDTEIGGEQRETTTHTNQIDFSIGIQFYFSALQAANH